MTLGQDSFVELDHPGRVTSIAFSPSGETVAAGFANGSIAAWSLDGRRLLFEAQSTRREQRSRRSPSMGSAGVS